MSEKITDYSREEMIDDFDDNYGLDSFIIEFNQDKQLLIVRTELLQGIEASHQFRVFQANKNVVTFDELIEDLESEQQDVEVVCTNCDKTSKDILEEIGFNTKNKVNSSN